MEKYKKTKSVRKAKNKPVRKAKNKPVRKNKNKAEKQKRNYQKSNFLRIGNQKKPFILQP